MSTLKQTLAFVKVNRFIELGVSAGRFTEDQFVQKLMVTFPEATSGERVNWFLAQFTPDSHAALLANPSLFEKASEAWMAEVRHPAERKNIAEIIALIGAPEEITPEELVMWASVASK